MKRAASLLAVVVVALAALAQDDKPSLLRGPIVSIDGKATTVDVLVGDDVKDVKLVLPGKTVPFEPVVGKRLRARIELAAGTSSAYDVVASVGSLFHGELKALPVGKKLNFCAVGDSGWMRRHTGEATDEQLAVAKLIEDQHPDLVVHTGDIIYLVGQPLSFDPLFFKPYGGTLARVPFFCTLGNHDVKTKDGKPTLDAFPYPANPNGNRFYSFDAANVHFACLDSNEILECKSEEAFLATAQGKWLVNDLAASKSDWKIAYCHHPLWSCTKNHKHDTQAMRNAIDNLLDQSGVDMVLAGHDHYYHRSERLKKGKVSDDGIVHLITGGGGAPLYQGEPKPKELTACYASRHHMVRFDVDGLEMHIQAIGTTADGKPEVFDETKISARKAK